ncbi:RusA family crossover junction endodeoxyribonuclease [Chloroflexota bacterium]
MKIHIDEFIEGIPYSKDKVRGDVEAPKRWSKTVEEATQHLPKVHGRVSINVSFILPKDKYPKDHPQGPDLDNLLKRFLDALCATVLSEAEGKDGAIVKLTVSKKQVRSAELSGVRMILNEL